MSLSICGSTIVELKKRCDCGKRFWTMDGYRGHYAYAHILGMEEAQS